MTLSPINPDSFKAIASELESEMIDELNVFYAQRIKKFEFDWVFDWLFLPYTYDVDPSSRAGKSMNQHYRQRYAKLSSFLTEQERATPPTEIFEFAYQAHAADMRALAAKIETLDSEGNQEVEKAGKRLTERLLGQAHAAIQDEIVEDLGDSDGILMMMAYDFIHDFKSQKKHLDAELIQKSRALVEKDAGAKLDENIIFLVFDPSQIVFAKNVEEEELVKIFVGMAYSEINTIVVNPRQSHRRMIKSGDLFVHELVHMLQQADSKDTIVDWTLCEGATETKTMELMQKKRTSSRYRPLLETYRRLLAKADDKNLANDLAYHTTDRLATVAISLYGDASQENQQKAFDWILEDVIESLEKFPRNPIAKKGLGMGRECEF